MSLFWTILICLSVIVFAVIGLFVWLLIQIREINKDIDRATKTPIIINGKLTPEKDIKLELDRGLSIDMIKNLYEVTKDNQGLIVRMWCKDGSEIHLSNAYNPHAVIDPFDT